MYELPAELLKGLTFTNLLETSDFTGLTFLNFQNL